MPDDATSADFSNVQATALYAGNTNVHLVPHMQIAPQSLVFQKAQPSIHTVRPRDPSRLEVPSTWLELDMCTRAEISIQVGREHSPQPVPLDAYNVSKDA
jgi:hypothetical protein